MTEQYVAPQIELVGGTDEVVLGLTGVGMDMGGEILLPRDEFEQD